MKKRLKWRMRESEPTAASLLQADTVCYFLETESVDFLSVLL